MLGQLGNDETGFKKLNDLLLSYVHSRQEGHTKAFLMAGLTNQPSAITDPDLRVIATHHEPYWAPFPTSWLKKISSGSQAYAADGTPIFKEPKSGGKTNGASATPQIAEVRRWINYGLVDGGTGWNYRAHFKPDGSLEYMYGLRCDAKEFDAKYEQMIKQVEVEARAEMKTQGISGLGSVHTFWALKRDKLKSKGIEWRSPEELNPHSSFD